VGLCKEGEEDELVPQIGGKENKDTKYGFEPR
jgi:hypothetical protein